MNIKWLLSCALLSGVAQANDSAIYEISVKGIDPMNSTVNSDLVRFYGKEAADFMKLIPPVETVPPFEELVAKHSHSLSIRSNAYTLSFHCNDATVEFQGEDPEAKVVAKPNPEGAVCAISLHEPFEDGDTLNFRRDQGVTKVIKQLR